MAFTRHKNLYLSFCQSSFLLKPVTIKAETQITSQGAENRQIMREMAFDGLSLLPAFKALRTSRKEWTEGMRDYEYGEVYFRKM